MNPTLPQKAQEVQRFRGVGFEDVGCRANSKPLTPKAFTAKPLSLKHETPRRAKHGVYVKEGAQAFLFVVGFHGYLSTTEAIMKPCRNPARTVDVREPIYL